MLQDAFDRTRMPISWDGIITRLTHEEWSRISSSNSTHYYTKGDAVIRINRSYDYGYANYAELSLHVPSPHFAQFAWHDFLEDDTHVALVEKLEPAPSDRGASSQLRPSLRALWQLGNYLLPYHEEELSEAGYPALVDRSGMSTNYDETYLSAQIKDLSAQSPALLEAIQLLQSYLTKIAQDDVRFVYPIINLGPHNLMIRRDAATSAETIVLVDPYPYDFRNEDGGWEDDEQLDTVQAVLGLPSVPNLKVYKFEHKFS